MPGRCTVLESNTRVPRSFAVLIMCVCTMYIVRTVQQPCVKPFAVNHKRHRPDRDGPATAQWQRLQTWWWVQCSCTVAEATHVVWWVPYYQRLQP